MVAPAFLSAILDPGRLVREVSDGIWSALPDGQHVERYDGRASAYDSVVGSRLYNRLFWGSSPAVYAEFAARAVRSGRGPLLDAGCGSLVFTADVYARAGRPLVLVDKSLGMLEAARVRLRGARSDAGRDIILLQADLLDLPFTAGRFTTILSMGMLHLFEDLDSLVATLDRALTADGQLFLTSLVRERRVGRAYLSMLHRAGEVARPRTYAQLLERLQRSRPGAPGLLETSIHGSMAFLILDR